MRFFANFRYTIKPEIITNPFEDGASSKLTGLKTGDYEKFDSDCSQTMVGFLQTNDSSGATLQKHKVQCFYAKQVRKANNVVIVDGTDDNGEKAAKVLDLNNLPADKPSPNKKTLTLKKETPETTISQKKDKEAMTEIETITDMVDPGSGKVLMERRKLMKKRETEAAPSDVQDLLIETINGMDLGWKADVCRLQSHHPKYDKRKCDKTNLAQVNSELEEFGSQKNFKEALELA